MRISDWSSDVCSSDLDPSAFRATAAPVKQRDYFGCPDEATFKALPPDERINRVRLAEAEEQAGIRAVEKAKRPKHPEFMCGLPAAEFQKLTPETRINLALKWKSENPRSEEHPYKLPTL